MRHALLTLIAAAALAAPAHAETIQGHLELQWGDPAPRAKGEPTRPAPKFRVTVIDDRGTRTALDPAQALAAAEDLHALSGRRVAVALAPAPARDASPWRVEAIVPATASADGTRPGAVLGTTVWRTVMCRFADDPSEPKSQAFFQGQYGTAPGQLGHYWNEVSYGKIELTGSSAHGWFTLPHPRAHYVSGSDMGQANLGALFDDCIAVADPQVDFGTGGGVQGINMMFNANLDCCAWGGSRYTTLDGVTKSWSVTWNPPWSFNNLAPLAHEMGHGYGLPHANNSDGDGDPYDNPWDVMSDAWNNAAFDATYGDVAKHLGIWHRQRLGWIAPARLREFTAGDWQLGLQLDSAGRLDADQPQMLILRLPGQPTSRYYTVESRLRGGYYEPALAGDAVIIHHIDTARGTPAQSVDADVPPATRSNNEGSMFKPGETWTAPDGSVRLRVLTQNAQGFRVSVCGPVPSAGPGRRFDRCNLVPVPGPVLPPAPRR